MNNIINNNNVFLLPKIISNLKQIKYYIDENLDLLQSIQLDDENIFDLFTTNINELIKVNYQILIDKNETYLTTNCDHKWYVDYIDKNIDGDLLEIEYCEKCFINRK